jgi:putative ABC transport system permease protein
MLATGDNEDMVRASSINTSVVKVAALALSNALVALSGGIIAQYQGFGDVSSGSGMIVVGLASVIIGEVIFGRRSVTVGLVSAVCGSVIYRIIIAFALQYNILSADSLKLLSAVIVGVTLSIPAIRAKAAARSARREAL